MRRSLRPPMAITTIAAISTATMASMRVKPPLLHTDTSGRLFDVNGPYRRRCIGQDHLRACSVLHPAARAKDRVGGRGDGQLIRIIDGLPSTVVRIGRKRHAGAISRG